MSLYKRAGRTHPGLGGDPPWYQVMADAFGEASASFVDGLYGKGAGNSVRAIHSGWSSVAFGQHQQPAPPTPSATSNNNGKLPWDRAMPWEVQPTLAPPPPPPEPTLAGIPTTTLLVAGGVAVGGLTLLYLILRPRHVRR